VQTLTTMDELQNLTKALKYNGNHVVRDLSAVVLRLVDEIQVLRSALNQQGSQVLGLNVETDRTLLLRHLGFPASEVLLVPLRTQEDISKSEEIVENVDEHIQRLRMTQGIGLKSAFMGVVPAFVEERQ